MQLHEQRASVTLISHGWCLAVAVLLGLAASASAQPPNKADYDKAAALAKQGNLKDAVTAYRAVVRTDPTYTEAMNDLAWILATADDATVRNPTEAVSLSERMVDGVIKGFINRRQMTGGKSAPAARTYAGLPRPPSFYKVTIISTLAAGYAAAGRFNAAGANASSGGAAISYGILAVEAARQENLKLKTPATAKLVATAEKYLATYKSGKALFLARPIDQQVIEASLPSRGPQGTLAEVRATGR